MVQFGRASQIERRNLAKETTQLARPPAGRKTPSTKMATAETASRVDATWLTAPIH